VRKLLTVLVIAVPLAAFPFALAACGGDDDDEETTAASSETTTTEASGGGGGAQTIDVSETEYAIDPADPTVDAGTVTFQVTNDGQVTHNLEIEGNGIEETEIEGDLDPGASGDLTVDLQPGTYEWYCPIDGHKDQGMEGEVTVK
jgi:uncharacterized cupredoxin-like copper-binding protein